MVIVLVPVVVVIVDTLVEINVVVVIPLVTRVELEHFLSANRFVWFKRDR